MKCGALNAGQPAVTNFLINLRKQASFFCPTFDKHTRCTHTTIIILNTGRSRTTHSCIVSRVSTMGFHYNNNK